MGYTPAPPTSSSGPTPTSPPASRNTGAATTRALSANAPAAAAAAAVPAAPDDDAPDNVDPLIHRNILRMFDDFYIEWKRHKPCTRWGEIKTHYHNVSVVSCLYFWSDLLFYKD